MKKLIGIFDSKVMTPEEIYKEARKRMSIPNDRKTKNALKQNMLIRFLQRLLS